jgi:hypothetical protein
MAILVGACALFVGCGIFSMIQQGRYDHALRFCADLSPVLEAHKEQHGVYPKDISDIVDISKAPCALKPHGTFYTQLKDGQSYWIAVHRPFDVFGRMKYRQPGTGWRNKDYW